MTALLLGGIGFGFGAIAGSYAATILTRWPRGASASRGRSHCDGCKRQLRAAELVPLLSWAAQRGRCRRCRTRIDPRHPAVELAAALVAASAFIAQGPVAGLAGAIFGLWLLTLFCLDLEHQWLPDALTLPLIPAGLAAALAGIGPPLADRAAGAAAGFAVLWLIARAYEAVRKRRGMGGGDPKLLAAIGAWLGWTALPFVLLGASLLGLAAILAMRARGKDVTGATRLPLGSLMAAAAWPIWLFAAHV
jgi:leader peptidase (prepilin peptidase)/N-methyltransferase